MTAADGSWLPTALFPVWPRRLELLPPAPSAKERISRGPLCTPSVWPWPRGSSGATTHARAGWLSDGPRERKGRRQEGKLAHDSSCHNPQPLEVPPTPDLKLSCCSTGPGAPPAPRSPPLPKALENSRPAGRRNLRLRVTRGDTRPGKTELPSASVDGIEAMGALGCEHPGEGHAS